MLSSKTAVTPASGYLVALFKNSRGIISNAQLLFNGFSALREAYRSN